MSEEAKLLGKSISYPKSYSPEILVAVPRSLNREIYGIYEPDKLFCGYDAVSYTHLTLPTKRT